MKTVQQTIQTVRASMEIDVAGARAEKAAADYAALCREAEQRLETVAAILEQGNEYQALQAAEQDPPLLDLVAALSFGGEKAWQTFCTVHQLEVAPRLPSATVQRLDALYAKGITANHPLYKDFRAAVLSRDDAKALQMVRTIFKLNPGDENARKELQRLENKHRQELLEELRTALKSGDDEKISTLTEAVSATGDEEKLMRYEAYSEGDRIRRALRRRQAEAALPSMVAEMTEKRQNDDWTGVGRFLERIVDAVAVHGLDLSAGPFLNPIQEMTAYYDRSLATYEHQQKFNVMLGAFSAFADEVEVRLMTGAGVSYQEVVAKDETFVRQWKELEALNLPVPADTLQRLQTVGQELRGRLEQLEKFRKRRTMAGLTAALVALLVLGGMGWFSWKAASLARELNDYVIKKSCAPTETLVTELRKNGGLLMKWPKLQAAVEEVDAWARQARIAEKQMAAKLQAIGTGVTTMPPEQLMQELADAESMIAKLPQDLALAQKRTFDELNTSAGLRVAEIRQEKKMQAEGGIKKLEQDADRELSFELPTVAVAAAVGRLNEQLRPFEELLTPVTEGLQLPADLSSRIITLRQKLTGFEDELKAFDQLREEAVSSTSLNEYKTALGKWQSVKFTEAGHALKALDVVPSEEVFLAILLTGADRSKLSALKDDKAASPMMPDEPTDRDIEALMDLRNDVNLNDIYENTVVDHDRGGATRIVFSQDELKSASVVGGGGTRWSGEVYDPAVSEGSVNFKKTEFIKLTGPIGLTGSEVRSSKLSGASQLMNVLLLSTVMDSDREKFERPLLALIGEIVANNDAPPLARAFLMVKLSEIALLRGDEWGVSFSTAFLADLQKLNQIQGAVILKSSDWMIPAQRVKSEESIASFFAGAGKAYLLEATKRRALMREAALAGLRFAGYIESDGRLVLNQSGRVEGELWTLSKQGDTALMITAASASAGSAESNQAQMVPQALPLSPVYAIPLDRKKVVTDYRASLSAAGVDVSTLVENSIYIATP